MMERDNESKRINMVYPTKRLINTVYSLQNQVTHNILPNLIYIFMVISFNQKQKKSLTYFRT